MDVTAIPFAVSYTDFISQAITSSKVLIALIGAQWLEKIHAVDDPVRKEIEVAVANQIAVLPVLIGNAPMPSADDLPKSISAIAFQNAMTVGVLHDFDTHMRLLLTKIESILGTLTQQSLVTSDPYVIRSACLGIIKFLWENFNLTEMYPLGIMWSVAGTADFKKIDRHVTFFLHRVSRLAELLELHFILSFWTDHSDSEHVLAGWVSHKLEQTPLIPEDFFRYASTSPEWYVKIRRSDEDPRVIWQMITRDPMRLSLSYIATVSPKPALH